MAEIMNDRELTAIMSALIMSGVLNSTKSSMDVDRKSYNKYCIEKAKSLLADIDKKS